MKSWYKSRTLWVNIVAAVAFFVQSQFGFVVPLELQGILLAVVNSILRFDTSETITK